MLSFEPRIVVVDDKPNEVEGILKRYREYGTGVKFFNADLFDGDEKPSSYYSNVNLIYLDVHFTDSFSDYDPELCSGWIESLVPENSFYILVLWSKDTDKKEEILNELKKVNRPPFLYFPEQKTDYQTETGWDFPKLINTIDKKLTQYPELNELALWKQSIVNSSNLVIGHLSKTNNPYDLKKKLQKIILSHGGTYLIGVNNENEKRKILFDAMDSILISNAKSIRPIRSISQENIQNLFNIPNFPKTDIDSKLNSWFHFNLVTKENIEKSDLSPGLICLNKSSLLSKLYSICDDPKLELKFKPQFEKNGAIIDDIVVVLNRPCDIAQNKFGKNIKLLSGIKIFNPKRYIQEELSTKQKKNPQRYLGKLSFDGKLPDSVKVYDHLSFEKDEEDVVLIFDFRYVFSVPENIFIRNFENIKIFNKELLSEVQVEYSSYSSRLGITQII